MSRSGSRQPPAWWYDGSTPPLYARCLALGYASISALRRWAYRRGWLRSHHPGVPVIVVGNLVAGGSGKTPLVIEIVRRLQAAGYAPGVASRGYGRSEPHTPRWVEVGMDVALSGDEPLLIAQATTAPVRVDRDRVAAAQALVERGCDIVVCDDGLQHYRLQRDVEIEVLDVRRRYGNGRLLPAGPLREPIERAADCDYRVLNFGASVAVGNDGAIDIPMRLVVGDLIAMSGGRALALSAFAGMRVHAVAGIGEPERFFSMLRDAGIAVVPHPFDDHHCYVESDFDYASQLPVLMTEKDAVKCAAFARRGWYSVPITAQLPETFWNALIQRITKPPG